MRLSRIACLFAALAACGVKPPKQAGDIDSFHAPPQGSVVPIPPEPPPPPASTAEYEDAKKKIDAGDLTGAEATLNAALSTNAKNYWAHVGLGMMHEKAGHRDSAASEYRQALNLKGDIEEAIVRLSAIYLSSEPPRVDDALAMCRAAVAKLPQSAWIHFELGVATAMAANSDSGKESALKELEEAIRLNNSEPQFHITYARWLNTWKMKGAAAHLDMAKQLVKDDATLVAIGREMRNAGDFRGCTEVFSKLVAKKDGGEVRTERALCKLGGNDEVGAIADLRAAIAKEPNYAPAHLHLGDRYASRKMWPPAIAEYKKGQELDPNGPTGKLAAERLAQPH
jgi:Tfp pilus assembly protein PilF